MGISVTFLRVFEKISSHVNQLANLNRCNYNPPYCILRQNENQRTLPACGVPHSALVPSAVKLCCEALTGECSFR